VLTTSVSQYSAISLDLTHKEISLDLGTVDALGLSWHPHDFSELVQGSFGMRSERGENVAPVGCVEGEADVIWRLPSERALARGAFRLCCGRRALRGYPRGGFLSLFHGPGYVGHQLFQIVLGGLKLRRLCVHFNLPIRRPPQGKGLARSIQDQSE
jgi:hypothetical protein